MLCAFGENRELSKTSNICANFKNIFENVGCTAFWIYQWLKDAKKVKKQTMKYRACVPLRCACKKHGLTQPTCTFLLLPVGQLPAGVR
jgi:hypothetical protein